MDGKEQKIIRFEHSLSDQVSQWVHTSAPVIYRAKVRCRAWVSPGNETSLILNWMDKDGHYTGFPVSDRLPPGDWSKGRELEAVGEAPAGVAFVGVGILIYHQTGRDFAEFSKFALDCQVDGFVSLAN